jgi:lipopolysaccharide/colanic/teichoic acid biosynthesis glycosyltransferase
VRSAPHREVVGFGAGHQRINGHSDQSFGDVFVLHENYAAQPADHNGNGNHGASGHNGKPYGGNGHNGNGRAYGGNGDSPNGNGRGAVEPHSRRNDFGLAGARMNGAAGDHHQGDGEHAAGQVSSADLVPYVMQGMSGETGSNTPAVRPLQALLARPVPAWKRAIDIVGAIAGMILILPLLIFVAAAIKLTSRGPIIFTQQRAGLGGRPFTIYKFRTMVNDAEAKKRSLRIFSEQDGPAFKLENDPRITSIGKLLRKSSIDELPQLWNVLKGDMSLVGPRPLPIDESDACQNWQRRRLDITPGLTCIWQVQGRSQVTFDEWVRMDVNYMRRRTILHDLSILLRTVPAVILRRGAR